MAPVTSSYRLSSSSRSSTAQTVLNVGGVPVATVEKSGGGEPYAEVINEPAIMLPYAKKHLGEVKFADLETQVSLDAHPALFRWIRDAWFGNPLRDKVVLETTDGPNTPSRTIELAKARVHEVVLPALDYNSREKRFLGLNILPRGIRRSNNGPPRGEAREVRDFLAHNFVVWIDGIDCSGVLSVDAVTVRTMLPEDHGGKKATLVFPDLHLQVDEAKVEPFREWFEDFVIRGNNDDDKEKTASVTYLDPMLGGSLAVLQLHHVGIFRVSDLPQNTPGPRRVKVDLYCERMELGQTEGAAAGDTAQMEPLKF